MWDYLRKALDQGELMLDVSALRLGGILCSRVLLVFPFNVHETRSGRTLKALPEKHLPSR